MNEFSDELIKERFIFLTKTLSIGLLGIYITFKMKRVSFINRLFIGSSKNDIIY